MQEYPNGKYCVFSRACFLALRNPPADDDLRIRERVHVAAHHAIRAKVREAAFGERQQFFHLGPGHACLRESRVISTKALEKLQLNLLATLEPIERIFGGPARIRWRVHRQVT